MKTTEELRKLVVELMENEGEGFYDTDDVIIVNDTIQDFDKCAISRVWSYEYRKATDLEGFPFVTFTKVQQFKGQPRRDLKIIDLGNVRGVIF